jgi:hypothetical protein
MLIDLVDAYMRRNLSTLELAPEMRRPPPDWDRALGDLIPHTDHVFRELKIYLALDDITDDNGLIIYWTGTHRTGKWRAGCRIIWPRLAESGQSHPTSSIRRR